MNLAFLKRNLGYKIFSLLVAILLYNVAVAQQNPRVTRQVFIQPEVTRLPGTMLLRDPPPPVALRVVGPEAVLDKLAMQPIKGTVDATMAREGANRLPLVLTLPAGVHTENGSGMPFAQFAVEKKDEKPYGVDVLFAGTAPPGQKYGDGVATPSTVTIQGLTDDLKRVGRVVASVEREETELTVERTVTLVAEDQLRRKVDGIEIIPPQVKVRVPLTVVPTTKAMLLSVEPMGKPAPGFRVTTYEAIPSQITVRGALEALSSRSSIPVPVDVTNIKDNDTKTVTLTLPPGLAPQQALPPIKVKLVVEPLRSVDGNSQIQAPVPSPSPSPVAASPSPSPAPGNN